MRNFFYLSKLLISAKFPQNLFLILKELKRHIYSNETVYGMHFDLTKEFHIPEPKIPISIRKLSESDIPKLLSLKENGIDTEELKKRLNILLLNKTNIPTCYIGLKSDGNPCVMCWLINFTENEKIRSLSRNRLPALNPQEVLCEGIFTHREYRGKHLMCFMTLKLFEKAKKIGARRAIAFVKGNNKSSLKGSKRIGWEPFIIKEVKWRMFIPLITYKHDLKFTANELLSN